MIAVLLNPDVQPAVGGAAIGGTAGGGIDADGSGERKGARGTAAAIVAGVAVLVFGLLAQREIQSVLGNIKSRFAQGAGENGSVLLQQTQGLWLVGGEMRAGLAGGID